MATDPARLQRLNNALLSVYYYGRQGTPALSGGPPRGVSILPLADAVAELVINPQEPVALRPMRLAILELCRTRAAAANPVVDAQIDRLARALAARAGVDEGQFAGQFAALFQMHATSTGDEAYMRAMNLLTLSFGAPPDHTPPIKLLSWKEGLR